MSHKRDGSALPQRLREDSERKGRVIDSADSKKAHAPTLSGTEELLCGRWQALWDTPAGSSLVIAQLA